MSYLVNEVLLRLVKLLAAGILGTIVYIVAVAIAGATPSFELAALSWISGGMAILLAESSPI